MDGIYVVEFMHSDSKLVNKGLNELKNAETNTILPKENYTKIKGLFIEVMPSANNIARARSCVIFCSVIFAT